MYVCIIVYNYITLSRPHTTKPSRTPTKNNRRRRKTTTTTNNNKRSRYCVKAAVAAATASDRAIAEQSTAATPNRTQDDDSEMIQLRFYFNPERSTNQTIRYHRQFLFSRAPNFFVNTIKFVIFEFSCKI